MGHGEGKGNLREHDFENEEEEVLLRPGDLPPIWKPEDVGETKRGELLSIRKLPFGEVLRIRTRDGIIAIPQSMSMAEIDFHELIGRRLTFIFKGMVETKSGNKVKLFWISVARKKDEGEDVPF